MSVLPLSGKDTSESYHNQVENDNFRHNADNRRNPIASKGLGNHDWVMESAPAENLLGNRLRELRRRMGLTQAQLAEKAGIQQTTISNAEIGVRDPNRSTLVLISQGLGIPFSQLEAFLLHGEEITTTIKAPSRRAPRSNFPPGTLPVSRGNATQGQQAINDFSHDDEWAESFVERGDVAGKNADAIRVVGDSMEPQVREGDLLICDPDVTPWDNCIVAVQLTEAHNSNNMVKRLSILPDGRYKLSSDNANHQAIIVAPQEIHWIGPMVEHRKDTRPDWLKKKK